MLKVNFVSNVARKYTLKRARQKIKILKFRMKANQMEKKVQMQLVT
jgi:hypothetical protein